MNCSIKVKPELNQFSKKIRFVDKIKISNKEYIVKKEIINKIIMLEYNFYIINRNKIVADHFEKFINIPINILNCKNSYIYIFNIIDYDFNRLYIKNINLSEWIDYTIQLCLTLYYMNHKLNFFHNDIKELRNTMVKINNEPFLIKVDDFNYEIKNNYVVVIDFGYTNKKQLSETLNFYNIMGKNNYKKYDFVSEILMVFFYSHYYFFISSDKVDIKSNLYATNIFDKLYNIFEVQYYSSSTSDNINLKDFDYNIISSLMYYKNNFNNL